MTLARPSLARGQLTSVVLLKDLGQLVPQVLSHDSQELERLDGLPPLFLTLLVGRRHVKFSSVLLLERPKLQLLLRPLLAEAIAHAQLWKAFFVVVNVLLRFQLL